MVLTKLNPTMWSIKKEVLAEARTTQKKCQKHCTLDSVEIMGVATE
jgi:hypothetical protein